MMSSVSLKNPHKKALDKHKAFPGRRTKKLVSKFLGKSFHFFMFDIHGKVVSQIRQLVLFYIFLE